MSEVATNQTNTVKLLNDMFTMQSTMNAKVNKDWITAGNDWMAAIMVEAVEAYDHTAWKWWKNNNSQPNWDQVQLEIVDIWHFILSKMMEEGWSTKVDEVANMIDNFPLQTQTGPTRTTNVGGLRESLKELINESIMDRKSSLGRMVSSLLVSQAFCGMSFEEVYKLYLPKNTLNIFRQNNGDKAGTYPRKWAGKEDNEYLTEIVKDIKDEDKSFDSIYKALQTKYDSIFPEVTSLEPEVTSA